MRKLDRLDFLKKMVAEEPEDPFNGYALALELEASEPQAALDYYQKVLREFPDYLPTYYRAAQFFSSVNLLEDAKSTFEMGIRLAENKKERKASTELRQAYQNFLFENDWEDL